MNTKSIPGTVGQKLRSPKTLLIGGLLLFFLVEPAAAQSGCSNTLVNDAIDILNQLTAILPIFGAIVFVYASWRYGVDQNNKSTYKTLQKNSLIYAILVPLLATVILTGIIEFVPSIDVDESCIDDV